MASLSISIDPQKLADLQAELREAPQLIETVIAAALNDAARRGQVPIARAAAKITTAKQKLWKKRVRQPRGSRARKGHLSCVLLISENRVALTSFRYRRLKRRGVKVEVYRGEPEYIEGAFIGTGPRGKEHILKRVQGKRRLTTAHYEPNVGRLRQNVATQYGISMSQAFDRFPAALDGAVVEINDILNKRLDSQLSRFLEKARKQGESALVLNQPG